MSLEKNFFIIFIFLIINIFLYFLKNSFYKKFLPIDKPGPRKIHSNPIIINGGLFFFVNFIFIILFATFFDNLFNNFFNLEIKVNIFISIFFLYVLGFIDDKYNLNSFLKLIFIIMILFFFLKDNELFLIQKLDFSFLSNTIFLGSYSIFFTILCISLFINSFNMFDGINLQSGFYSLSFFVFFLLLSFNLLFCLIFIIPHILFLIKNYKNESFLGDGGCYILSFIISIFIINYYNLGYIKSDQIFLLMMLPGIDMLRLFIMRIIKKRNPFSGDSNHIHHILLKSFPASKVFLIIFFLNFINFLFVYFNLNSLIAFFISLISYFYIIFKFKVFNKF